MGFAGIAFIIVLTIALVLAVGWVVVSVGRVVFCIVRDARRARRHPPRYMEHPEFGPLTLDGELWRGQVQRQGRSIDFTIAGKEGGPDAGLSERLRDVIGRFPEFERTAIDFVRSREPSLPHAQLTFESLDFLFERRPEVFAMEFTLPEDLDGCWRVEFEAGRPWFVGRDD